MQQAGVPDAGAPTAAVAPPSQEEPARARPVATVRSLLRPSVRPFVTQAGTGILHPHRPDRPESLFDRANTKWTRRSLEVHWVRLRCEGRVRPFAGASGLSNRACNLYKPEARAKALLELPPPAHHLGTSSLIRVHLVTWRGRNGLGSRTEYWIAIDFPHKQTIVRGFPPRTVGWTVLLFPVRRVSGSAYPFYFGKSG
jgi:hypothetical protein